MAGSKSVAGGDQVNNQNVGLTGDALREAFLQGAIVSQPQEVAEGSIPFVVVPQGYTVASLKDLVYHDQRERPTRKEAQVAMFDPESLIEYWLIHHTEDSQVFADPGQNRVSAIFDYHGGAERGAAWCKHRATYTAGLSRQWELWTSKNLTSMDQEVFGTFLEDHAVDVANPSGADLKEMVLDMEGTLGATFVSKRRLSDGKISVVYQDTSKTTTRSGELAMPETFTLRIPIYFGMAPVELTARLRFRITDGSLSFWYALLNPEAAKEAAFDSIVHMVEHAIDKKVFLGRI